MNLGEISFCKEDGVKGGGSHALLKKWVENSKKKQKNWRITASGEGERWGGGEKGIPEVIKRSQ